MGPRRQRTGGPRRAAGGRSGQADGAGRCRRGTDGEAATGGARGALSAARAREATGGRAAGQKNGSRVDAEVTLLTLTLPALIPCYRG